MKYLVIFSLFIWCMSSSAQQKSQLTGVVRDGNHVPIHGATMFLEMEKKKFLSLKDGSFYFQYNAGDRLIVSAIGFRNDTIPLTDQSRLEINLVNSAEDIEQVVIVGYGQQKKVSVTGAIASIGTKELQQSPVANLSNALAGRLPGLITLQNSGEPGYDGAQLWIRGMATFTGSTSPLILVDGVERSFSSLDANEVESISILKDASSTAVYGVRGANGVVLVTTRRGAAQKPNITFTAQSGIQTPTRLPKYLDSYDALTLFREGLINDGLNYAQYTDEYLNKFRDRTKPAYEYLYPNVNWIETMLKDNSSMNQANLNVSGGTDRARYFVSLSWLKQNGLYKFEDRVKDYDIQAASNRYNFRSNVDLDVTKNLKVELNIGTIIRDNNYPNVSAGSIFGMLQSTPPWLYPLTNPDGSIPHLDSKAHSPYGQMTARGYQRNFWNNFQSTAGFNFNMPFITQGLSARARVSFDVSGYRNVVRNKNVWNYQWTIADENETDLSKGVYRRIFEGTNTLSYDVSANQSRRTLLEASLNYNRKFSEKHEVTGMLLYTQQSFFDQVGSGNAIGGLPMKYNGLVGRLTYGLLDRYFSEVNFGYNGSENFPEGQRYALFPSFSLAWVISEERFAKDYLSSFNLLKIRGSAGLVGNDQIGGRRFLYQSTWEQGAAGYQFGKDYNGVWYGGATEGQYGNPIVTWEKAWKYNLGLDLGVFESKLTMTGDVFYEKRSNILAAPGTMPSTVGLTSLPLLNLGVVENKGFELEMQHRSRIGEMGYFLKGNFSYAKNKILEMDEASYVGREYRRQTGRSVNDQYGLIAEGLFQSQEDIDKSADQTSYGRIIPGDIKYKDMNGDGVINELDRAYFGKESIPTKILGFAMGINYKNFDVSILLQGGFGGNVWLTGDVVWPFSGDVGVLADVKDNYWTTDNPNAKYPRLSSSNNVNNNQISSFWVTSRDYLRLKNAEIGYSVPSSWLNKYSIRSLRLFATGINLFTWDKLKIFDPEIPNDSRNYPQQRVMNFGLSLGF